MAWDALHDAFHFAAGIRHEVNLGCLEGGPHEVRSREIACTYRFFDRPGKTSGSPAGHRLRGDLQIGDIAIAGGADLAIA